MRSTTVALSATEPPNTAVDVIVGFVRDLLEEATARQSLRETTDRLLSVTHFAKFVVARSREFVSGATEQDRPRLLDLARNLGTLARALDDSHDQLKRHRILRSMPIRGRLLLRRLDNLAEEAEEAAENAALGASAPFAERVRRELATV